MVETKVINGKMNKDSDLYRLPSNDFTDALNITRSNLDVVYNLQGNVLVNNPFLHNTGVNKLIGRKEDITRNRIYAFIWNSLGYHVICYYNQATDTFVKVLINLTDTGGVDILEFNPSFRINHVDIIYRDVEGDLMMWVAGNSTPKCANVVKLINGEYGIVKKAFIEQAKKPTLSPPKCLYGTDSARNANALRRSLFQFTSRPVFADFQKATFSTYSKIALPIGYYGSDNNIDNTKNNFITITIETGDKDVKKLEIAMRYNIANLWSDFVLIASLNKSELGILDNSTYQFLFYNDGIYPPIDINETLSLFDYVPQIAGTQALANGNVPVYGDIIEGYDNYPVSQLDVTITSTNIKNVPPDTDPASITYTSIGTSQFTFTIKGTVLVGTKYTILMTLPPNAGPLNGTGTLSDYTSVAGDTIANVVAGMANPNASFYTIETTGTTFTVSVPSGSSVMRITVIQGNPGTAGISTEKTWLWDCNYIMGIVYVDEQNRDIPGVTTFSNPINTDKDFLVTTPTFSLDGTSVKTPVIHVSINHLPPANAVKYYWVRRRLTYGAFLMYETCDYKYDPDADGHLYFCVDNIDYYYGKNNQFIYSQAGILKQSRIKIIAGITAGAYDGDIYKQDYEIVGTVTKTLTGGTAPADNRVFIKVKMPIAGLSPAYKANMLVMIYTPPLNPISASDSVYWEWGEAYDIHTVNGVNYHQGQLQNQTSLLPATFDWAEGDVYFHQRTMYKNILVGGATTPSTNTLNLMDGNYSDFFNSLVNDNGRPQIVDVNAKKQKNPVLIRFGGAFQAGTNINDVNKFPFLNFDEYSRDFGTIKKLFIEGRRLYVFQQFNVGVVPILTQIIKDTSGNPLEANSDQLLNKIQYPYIGKHGIGDTPESFAFSSGNMYYTDSNAGVVIRIGGNGQEQLSVVYKMNNYFIDLLAAYGKGLDNGIVPIGETYLGHPTVNGVFDDKDNKYIMAFEEIKRYSSPTVSTFQQAAVTIGFYEVNSQQQGFESRFSYLPEGMVSLNNLLVSFKGGNMWRHNSSTYNTFYGVVYDSSITLVFNQNEIMTKTFTVIQQIASAIWGCPEIVTAANEYGTTKQTSLLLTRDFKGFEGKYSASFLKALNSTGGLLNGSSLKGNLCTIKFTASSATNLITLELISVKSIPSSLNLK